MVAKSYQGLEIVQEPYKKNGKMYVMIKNKKGALKEVRWYNDVEYAKMYPDVQGDKSKDPYYRPQKYVLGFEKGYITIFRGVKEEHEEWFKQSICRFARWWGWYVISTQEVPKDLPSGVESVRLYWDPMGNEKEWLKEEKVVRAHVYNTLYPKKEDSKSKPQGKEGERIQRVLTIEENIVEENKRFNSITYTHYMRDSDDNLYKWKTAAKNWCEGSSKTVRGTIKEFETYKGEIVTVLTRCIEQ